MKLIGLDIGTTSIRGVVMNARTGETASVHRSTAPWLRSKQAWERMQDAASIAGKAQRLLTDLLATHPGVEGIGVTGQMHGIVYTGNEGRAVSPLYGWQDARGGLPFRRGKASYAETLSRETGYAVAPGFGMATHWYNLRNGLVPGAACRFCTIADYVVMQLTGNQFPLMDPTDAASLGVFDLKTNSFDKEALANARVGLKHIPDVAPSGTQAGCFRGVPVFSALGDNQASFLGSVRDVARTLLVNIGTGGQISAFTRRYVPMDALDLRPFPGGGYLLVGALLCGGKAYAMLEHFFRRTAAFFSLPSASVDFYARMNAVAYPALVEKLRIDTRFAGTRQNAALRGAIQNIGTDNLTPEHLIAGVLDGIAGELHDCYASMPASVRRAAVSLVGAGNGLRRNGLLCRILSGRFDRPMRIPVHCEEAAVGAALTAAVGGGYFGDFHSAGHVIRHRNWRKEE